MALILVVGATGLLGGEICRQLRTRQQRVRALVREGSPHEASLRRAGVEIVHGDLKDPVSLAHAVRGASMVITTANAILSRRRGDTLESVDRQGSLGLLRAAVDAHVNQFIYTSVSQNIPANNPFVRYKREVEAAVRTAGVPWTILQPSAFMEIHAGPVGGWDFTAGRARLTGSGQAVIGYVSTTDVAACAVAAVEHPAAAGRVWHITGPEPLTGRDAVAIAERITGRRFRVQRVPVGALHVLRLGLMPFHPSLSSLFAMGIGMEGGEHISTHPFDELEIAPTTFEQYVRRQLKPNSVST